MFVVAFSVAVCVGAAVVAVVTVGVVVAVASAVVVAVVCSVVFSVMVAVGIAFVFALGVVVVVVMTFSFSVFIFGDDTMKKVVEIDDGEGLVKLMGQRVTLFCCRYIYTGVLAGVDATCVLLKDAKIVYETGELTTKEWADAQPLPNDWYVQAAAIESFGILK